MDKKPRHVRNFWLELEVDGKKTKVATGPVAKEGGFSLKVYMRHKGESEFAGQLTGMLGDDLKTLGLLWGELEDEPSPGDTLLNYAKR